MGTPEFAVPSLRALCEHGYEVVGVFTQPDRPSGRGNKVRKSPVKVFAESAGIPVFQPEKIRRDGVEDLSRLQPDLCVTAAFGQILSQEILDIPPMGTVNVHASLLPRHRGSAPIAWAILQGDEEIGVTTMLTARGIDNGDMLLKASQVRDVSLTCGEMTEKLSQIGADLLLSTLREMEAGTLVPEKQKEEDMTYDPMLQKDMGIIDWTQSGAQVRDRIHGLNPWPACTVPFEGGRLKLLRAQAVEGEGKPGTVLISDSREGLVIACGEGAVRILEMQASGGRAMAAKDYLRGHAIDVGTILEDTE